MQNQLFSIFMLMTVFGNMAQMIMPHFVTQRSLYEVRERPSKTYSWVAFMLANIAVEIPWHTLMAAMAFVSFYYPVGLDKNAAWLGETAERGGLFFLLVLIFYLFTSTFSHMVIAGIDTAENGGNIANIMFTLCLIFSGCVTFRIFLSISHLTNVLILVFSSCPPAFGFSCIACRRSRISSHRC